MLKIWTWIKEHWQILIGALGAIIGGFLVWGAYHRKVNKLKDTIEVEKAVNKVAKLEAKMAVLTQAEKQVEEKDKAIEKQIVAAKKQAVKVREDVDKRTPQEIADRFNQLYRR